MTATSAPGHAALRTATPLIAAADLGYGGAPVLREVTLDLATGERVALLGRSGAGKSTLLDAVWAALVAQGQRVALVPQDHGLVPQLSVLRNALMGRLDDHGAVRNLATFVHPRRAERAAVAAILTEVGLAPEIDRPVGRLSGGQRQRTALARALYRGGDVLPAVKQLLNHPDFNIRNPNRARSVIFSYCSANPGAFHRSDGAGYAFWSERVIELDAINPQVAARLARALDRWQKLAEPWRTSAHAALARVAAHETLSNDVREVITRALAT